MTYDGIGKQVRFLTGLEKRHHISRDGKRDIISHGMGKEVRFLTGGAGIMSLSREVHGKYIDSDFSWCGPHLLSQSFADGRLIIIITIIIIKKIK